MRALSTGQLIGQYKVVQELGEGGMALVYHARDLDSGADVALKLLKPAYAKRPDLMERLRREAEALKVLSHPSIVRCIDVGQDPKHGAYVVMERLAGGSLRDLMQAGPLRLEDLAPIIRDTAVAMGAAHEANLVHRDLKPDNIFLDQSGRVVLLDFGIAKAAGHERLTRTGELLGSPRYMSPEQLSDSTKVDHRSDLYSLGVVTYEALAGTPPIATAAPQELIVKILAGDTIALRVHRPDLPADVLEVVTRAIAREPAARYQSASAFVEAWTKAAPQASPDAERPTSTVAFGAVPNMVATAKPTRPAMGTFQGNVTLEQPLTPLPPAPESGHRPNPGTFSQPSVPPVQVFAPVAQGSGASHAGISTGYADSAQGETMRATPSPARTSDGRGAAAQAADNDAVHSSATGGEYTPGDTMRPGSGPPPPIKRRPTKRSPNVLILLLIGACLIGTLIVAAALGLYVMASRRDSAPAPPEPVTSEAPSVLPQPTGPNGVDVSTGGHREVEGTTVPGTLQPARPTPPG